MINITHRPYMEDRIFGNVCLEGSDSPHHLAFLGVFDGHNGKLVHLKKCTKGGGGGGFYKSLIFTLK